MTPNFIPAYTRLETGDGSPTLKLSPDGESMHAMDGAFTETQYIYQPAIERAFGAVLSPSILSVGLGIGYNEILVVCEALKHQKDPSLILSYESVASLRDDFKSWVLEQESPLADVYDLILSLYASRYQMDAVKIKSQLCKYLKNGILKLEHSLDEATPMVPCHAILFDAFSKKETPHLWDETFLTEFFRKAVMETCFVSTYACTGNLKRALKNNGFTLEIKKGFGVKRESTFAFRATESP